MKTIKEIDHELKNLYSELNDPDMVLDPEWREFLEEKQRELWALRQVHPENKERRSESMPYACEY